MKIKRKTYSKEPRLKMANWAIQFVESKGSCRIHYHANKKECMDHLRRALDDRAKIAQVFRLTDNFVEAWQGVEDKPSAQKEAIKEPAKEQPIKGTNNP